MALFQLQRTTPGRCNASKSCCSRWTKALWWRSDASEQWYSQSKDSICSITHAARFSVLLYSIIPFLCVCVCICAYLMHNLQQADNNEWGKYPNDLISGEDWLRKCWWIHYSLLQLFGICLRWYLCCGRNLSWWLITGLKWKRCQIYPSSQQWRVNIFVLDRRQHLLLQSDMIILLH